MTTNKSNSSEIKILHLSDLHYDSTKPKDTEIVLNALWKDLDNFPNIDFVLFSGDLVKIGDKKAEFEKARQMFITPLLRKIHLPPDRFFFVPGNHDMQMSAIDPITEEGLKAALVDRETLNAFLDKEKESDFPHIERLGHFNTFKNRFPSEHTITSNKLFSTHKLQKKSAPIGIACLNSSWRATGKGSGHDKGRLLIGERQIYDALQDIKDCNIKIALFHHALDWLSEYDLADAKRMFYREFDLIFCGHLHDPNLELVQNFGNQTLLIQSGCLYKGRSFYNGYSVLHLNTPTGEGTIHLRTYFDDRQEFDRALNKCKNGQFPIMLDRKNEDDKKRSSSSKERGSVMIVNIGTIGEDATIVKRMAVNTDIGIDELSEKNSELDIKVNTIKGDAVIAELIKTRSES